jgi:hypothetical protein
LPPHLLSGHATLKGINAEFERSLKAVDPHIRLRVTSWGVSVDILLVESTPGSVRVRIRVMASKCGIGISALSHLT